MYTTFCINSTKNCRNLTGFRRISTEIPLALTENWEKYLVPNIKRSKEHVREGKSG